jgi:transposase InsO family protein
MDLIYERRFEARQQVRAEIFIFIEVWYNGERLHPPLGYLSPADYEEEMALQTFRTAA